MPMDENNKKSLKQQRVSSYFVEAAKDIILSEGVENVSVRRVAELAGYTFSSIYKYYKDLDALLRDVKSSMIRDVVVYMQTAVPDKVFDLDDIRRLNRAYAAYYFERPHVFRFFYSYRLKPEGSPAADLPDFGAVWSVTYRGLVLSGHITVEDIPVIAKTLIYALQGLLALYFSGYGMTEELVFSELDQVTDYLLGGKKSL